MPPQAPGTLSAELTPEGDALLRWMAPASAEDRAPVSGYEVYLESAGGRIETLGNTRSLSYRHRGLQAGQRYVYHVRALSAVGPSVPSESVYVDVPSEPAQPPEAPGSLAAEFVPSGEVLLRWTAPTPAPSRASVIGYRVYREFNDGRIQTLGNTRSLSYRHRGLQAGQRYVYHVQALSAAGESPPSESAFVDVPSGLVPPEAPGGFTADLAASGREALLRWTPPAPADGRAPVTGYRVYLQRGAEPFRVLGTTSSLSYRHQGLQAGQRYVYHVRALSTAGTSLPSTSAYVDVPRNVGGLLPPDAPGSLTVELVPGDEGQPRDALLRWTAPSPAEGRAPVTGYEIHREGASRNPIGTTTGALSFRDTGLSRSTRHVYHVRALSTAGKSLPSASAYVDVPPGPVPPEPPHSLGAELTPENNVVLLRWTAPAPAEGRAPVVGYEIYHQPAGNEMPERIGRTAGALSFRYTGLSPGTRFVFYVLAVGAGDKKSQPSESLFVDTAQSRAPPAPRSLTATLTPSGDVLLRWEAPASVPGRAPVTSYEVCNDDPCNRPLGTTTFLSYRDSNPSPGTQAYYVRAVNAAGKSPPSASVSVDVPEKPEAPGSLSAELTPDGEVLLRWEAPTPAAGRAPVTGYTVYRKEGNATPVAIGRTTGALSFRDTGVSLGTTYVYHVVALSATGISDPSATVSVEVPLLLPPEAPGSFTAELTANGEALLRWTPPAPAESRAPVTGYRVYYKSTSEGGALKCIGAPEECLDVEGGALSYLHRGLSPGTYVYHVRARSDNTLSGGTGESTPSASAFVEVPGVPGLPLAAPRLSVRAYDDAGDDDRPRGQSVQVSWIQPLSDPPSSVVMGFSLQYCNVIPGHTSDHCPVDGWQAFSPPPETDLATDPKLRSVNDVFDCNPMGTDRTMRPARMYRIQALASKPALSSPWSATVGPVCPSADYSPPRRVDAVFVAPPPGEQLGSTFNVCWEVPVDNNSRVTGYEIQMSPDEELPGTEDGWWVLDAHVNTTDGAVLECRLYSGLAKDDKRWFRIRAYNLAGHGDWSAPYRYAHKEDQPVPSSSLSAPISEGVLTVADAHAFEREGARLEFAVTLDAARPEPVTVDYATEDGTATAGEDYVGTQGELVFAPGETAKRIGVPVLDDARDEGEETLTLSLRNAVGARIADAEATGTIENDDRMPAAWLARFGRTVAAQTVDAMGERFASAPGSRVSVGGVSLRLSELRETPLPGGDLGRTRWPEDGGETQTLAGQALLHGSAFHLATPDSGGPIFSAWGRFATGGFDAVTGNARLDGEATTGFLGMDMDGGRWLAGAVLSHSEGEGTFRLESAHREETRSTLTGVYPYARLRLDERVSLWGLAGGARGALTLSGSGGPALETDIDMALGAVGARAALLSPARAGGLALDLRSDAFWTRTRSDALRSGRTASLAATRSDAGRLRVLLEGARTFPLDAGGTLTPSVEAGVRLDGGDAETGVGLEVGAGLRYAGVGVTVGGTLRTLLAHHETGYEEWEASARLRIDPPVSGRGLSLSLAPTLSAAGGAAERPWWGDDAQSLLAESAQFEHGSRLEAELGYGVSLSGLRGLLTPYGGLSLRGGGAHEWRLGARWAVMPSFGLSLEGAHRRAAGEEDSDRALMLRGALEL